MKRNQAQTVSGVNRFAVSPLFRRGGILHALWMARLGCALGIVPLILLAKCAG